MTPEKHKLVEDKMLKEFYDFAVKNRRVPSIKEFNNKTLFTYGYGSYLRRFNTMDNMIKRTHTAQYIPNKPPHVKQPSTKYSLNLKTYKIRTLIHKNPNAGYKELKELFGEVTRSIRVTYYRLYKEMYGRSGSLYHEAN